MISIKQDVQSKNPKTQEIGYFGAKSEAMEMTCATLLQTMKDAGYEGMHELLTGQVYHPYGDLDKVVECEEKDFEKVTISILLAGKDAFEDAFCCESMMYCSSGIKSDGTKKVSAHFVGQGMIYSDKEHIRFLMKDIDASLGFDMAVYNKDHLMRLPYCKKPDDDRVLRMANVGTVGQAKEQWITYEKRNPKNILCGLITALRPGDELQGTPDGYIPPAGKAIAEIKEVESEKTEAQKAANFEHMTNLIKALSGTRAEKREGWSKGVWAIRRVAENYGQVGAYLALAHEFAKKTGANNYCETSTVELYLPAPRDTGVGYTTLRKWADEDSPGWDAPSAIVYGEEFSIDLIKEKIRNVKTEDDLWKFKDVVTEYMNRYYTLVKWGRKPFIIWETYEIKDGNRVKILDYKDTHSLTIDFKNKTMPYKLDGAKKTSVFCPLKCWLEHPQRSEKDRVYFNPREMEDPKFADPRAYNLFDGLAIQPKHCQNAEVLDPKGPWLQHILRRWCDGNEILYNRVLDTFALQIQKPWVKQGVALGLMSPEGAGKGLILQSLFKIIGMKYVAIPSSPDQVLGKFNSILEGKLVVFLDELTWGGDKEREGALKRLTTETTMGLERKGIDPIQIENPANVICCSNEDWMAPASKNARRLFLLRLSNELAGTQSAETSAIIEGILSTPILSIAKFLYSRDLSNFNPRKIIATEALRSQQIESMNPIDQACLTMLNRGIVKINGADEYISGGCFNKQEFFESVGASVKYMTDTKFWIKIRAIWPSVKFTRPTIDHKKVSMVGFPTLDQLKQEWRAAYKDENWEFDTPEEEE